MKTKLTTLGLTLLAATALAQTSFTNSGSSTITAGDPSGVVEQIDVDGLTGALENITVNLDIAGGYNGSLYATLTGPDGQKAVLLNRPGVGSGDAFGYADAGFAITLDDSGGNANIHNYGSGSYSTNSSGQVTGTWGSDGRDIDPQSPAGDFDTASTGANLSLFTGGDANGEWQLFISSMAAGGGDAILDDFSVTITTLPTPEPSMLAMAGMGLAGMGLALRRRLW